MSILQFADYSFNSETGTLTGEDGSVRLRPKTAKLLSYFLSNTKRVLTRESLLDAIWADRVVTDNTLMQSVRELRAALDDPAASPRLIETAHGRGYLWIGPEPVIAEDLEQTQPSVRRPSRPERSLLALAALGVVAVIGWTLTMQLGSQRQSQTSIEEDIQRAQSARAQGEFELAHRYYEAALIRDPEDLDARAGFATMSYEIGDWQTALRLSASFVDDQETGGSAQNIALLHLIAGQIALEDGRIETAEKNFSKARNIASQSFSPVVRAAALSGLSQVFADQGRIAEYLDVRAEAVDPLMLSTQVEAFAEGMLSAGTAVHPSFSEHWSLERLKRAENLFREIDDVIGVARARAALGGNRALDGSDRERYLQKASETFRSSGHQPGEIMVLMRQASFEIERLNAERAQSHIRRGLELSDALGARRSHANFVYYLGLSHMVAAQSTGKEARIKQIEEAITAFNEAMAEYEALGVVFDGLAPRLHAAIARLDAGAAAEALPEFVALSQVYHDLPFPRGALGAGLGEAAALAQLNRDNDAEQRLLEIEKENAEVAPVAAMVRTEFLTPVAQTAETSLFDIIIGAERLLAKSPAISD